MSTVPWVPRTDSSELRESVLGLRGSGAGVGSFTGSRRPLARRWHSLRHAPGTGRHAVEVARGILDGKVPPALKRSPGARLHENELGLEHEKAPADAALVNERANIDQALPTHHFAADHPVERSTVAQLFRSLGHHAGSMHVLAR